MSKDRYDFIQELLDNNKLTTVQRERILLLTKEEIKKDGIFGKLLDERVTKLEGLLNGNGLEVNQHDIDEGKEILLVKNPISLPIYIYPSSLYKYLFDFNQNSILKSTCHEIDSSELENILNYCGTESYIYEKHLEKIIEAFRIHDEQHFAPPNIKSLIRGYLTGKDYSGSKVINGWSSHRFQINWSCQDLMNWCNQNPGIPPNMDGGLRRQKRNTGFEIRPNINLKNGIVIQKFSELVLCFKHLFHIRSANSLKSIILNENESKHWNDRINFEINDHDFPNNIEFFTDVDKLIQSYNRIIELIIEQNRNSKIQAEVRLSLTENHNGIKFFILHKESVYGKSLKNSIDRLGNTYTNLIKNQINGLCNFYVQADFEKDGSYRIGIWDKPKLWVSEKPIVEKLKSTVGGVEHIFEIVKNKR